jgi:hypothetical protein
MRKISADLMEPIHIVVPSAMRSRLISKAASAGVPMAALVRTVLEAGLDALEELEEGA